MAQGNIEEITRKINASSHSSLIWSYIRSTIQSATNLPTAEQAVSQLTTYGLGASIAKKIYNYYKDPARRRHLPDVEHGGSAGWRGGGRRKYKRKKYKRNKSSKKKKKKKSKRKKSKTRRR